MSSIEDGMFYFIWQPQALLCQYPLEQLELEDISEMM